MLNYRTLLLVFIAKHVFTMPTEKEEQSALDYRLKNVCTPSSYELKLTLNADAFTNTSDTFTGSVLILLNCINTTKELTLHADYNFIKISSIEFNNLKLETEDYAIDNTTNMLKINLEALPIAVDLPNRMKIDYTSRLSTEDMYGFYKSSYEDVDGNTTYVATTQFEPTYARRALPCFDEPDMKAEFELYLTVPEDMEVLFNTEALNSITDPTNRLKTIQFKKTPKMSTYLFAIVVSDFTCTSGLSIDNITYQVCSRNESIESRNFAVDVGPKILEKLNNYTNYRYAEAMSQSNQVAIPDFAAGAMENWGLVTYRESALLWDEKESSSIRKQGVATTIAHELAHQWFGNLVTIKWWSELFLNEGFATYFQYHIMHEIYPEWELDKQFLTKVIQPALVSDELENAQALESECSAPAEISAKFGVSSYSKGASVLNMVKHMMGENSFKLGLQDYIQRYKFENTEPKNLWETLNERVEAQSEFPTDLSTIMENWTKLSGFPLLHVEAVGSNITVSQKRLLSSNKESLSKWYVPVSYTQSTSKNKFNDTTPTDWLLPSENSTNILLDESYTWVILNNQATGYYRVDYSDILWTKINEALLKDDFDGILEENRAQIVDDLFYLAKANLQSYSTVLKIIEFLNNDTSFHSWFPAFNGYNYLLKRVGTNSKLGQAISEGILKSMSNIYESVPISQINNSDHLYTLKQALAVEWACKLGHENCITEIEEKFVNYRNTSIRPDTNLRSIIYCYGLMYSNDSVADWNFLWGEYKNTTLATEKLSILSALSCTNNSSLLNDLLSLSINDSDIRSQDASSIFTSVYGNPNGVDTALEFLTNNYLIVSEKYQGMGALGNMIKGIADYFTTESQVTKLKGFIQSENLPDDFKVAANEAVEIAEKNLEWQSKFTKDLNDFYNITNDEPTSTTTISTTIISTTTDNSDATSTTINIIFILSAVIMSKVLF